MCNRYAGIFALVLGLFFIAIGVAQAANIKIEIDPATGKPKVRSDVPVVSTTTTHTGWTVLTLSTGEQVGYFIGPAGNVSVQVFSGTVNVVAGNMTARVEAGEAAAVSINRKTGTAQIASQKGLIDVSAQGKRVRIKPGQQTVVSQKRPPAPPAPARAIPVAPAPSFVAPPTPVPAPEAAPVHPAAFPPPVAPAPTPAPPKYQVDPTIQPPPPKSGVKVEKFHGQPPASPAE